MPNNFYDGTFLFSFIYYKKQRPVVTKEYYSIAMSLALQLKWAMLFENCRLELKHIIIQN